MFQVATGAVGVHLSHLLARDCRVDGVVVRATGAAEIANATLVGNATALQVAGTVQLKNSLVAGNGVALAVEPPGRLDTSYDDLFDNQTNRVGATSGTGDLALSVTFADLPGRNLRLTTSQPSTNLGDPADEVGAEPSPNGGRIDLGAFGGTADAETTAPSTVGGGPSGPEYPNRGAAPPGDAAGADAHCRRAGARRGMRSRGRRVERPFAVGHPGVLAARAPPSAPRFLTTRASKLPSSWRSLPPTFPLRGKGRRSVARLRVGCRWKSAGR